MTHWSEFGIRHRQPMSARTQVVEDLWQGHLLGHVQAIAIGRPLQELGQGIDLDLIALSEHQGLLDEIAGV